MHPLCTLCRFYSLYLGDLWMFISETLSKRFGCCYILVTPRLDYFLFFPDTVHLTSSQLAASSSLSFFASLYLVTSHLLTSKGTQGLQRRCLVVGRHQEPGPCLWLEHSTALPRGGRRLEWRRRWEHLGHSETWAGGGWAATPRGCRSCQGMAERLRRATCPLDPLGHGTVQRIMNLR